MLTQNQHNQQHPWSRHGKAPLPHGTWCNIRDLRGQLARHSQGNTELGVGRSGLGEPRSEWNGGKWKGHMNSEGSPRTLLQISSNIYKSLKYHEITKIGIHHTSPCAKQRHLPRLENKTQTMQLPWGLSLQSSPRLLPSLGTSKAPARSTLVPFHPVFSENPSRIPFINCPAGTRHLRRCR